jgi:hypothetical protein
VGKQGVVIKAMREESGANIRVLPKEHLPPCAMEAGAHTRPLFGSK